METRVSLHRCATYAQAEVEAALAQCLNNLGGLASYIKPGMRVALKCNLLLPMQPHQGGTTHPSLVEALVREIQKIGAVPFIIDSPGGPYNKAMLRTVYRATGMHDVSKKTGAELNLDTSVAEADAPHARFLKRMAIIKPLLGADAVIDLPKMKTHGFMLFTGAVKNMFGAIPGVEKAEYHLRMKAPEDFRKAMVDICETVRPVLTIMDGVEAMEGNGPSAGVVKKANILLASPSPYAADLAAAWLGTLPIERIYTIQEAGERGLGPADADQLHWLGDDPESLRVKFALPESQSLGILRRFVRSRFGAWMQPRPVIDRKICMGCGICAQNCPPKTIDIADGKASIRYDDCIRCYCCQELCPEKAVAIRRSFLFNLLK